MRGYRVGFRLLRIGSGVPIDLENQACKNGGRRQLLLRTIDKCMSGEQARVNGFDRLLNAGRYVDAFLVRLFSLGI